MTAPNSPAACTAVAAQLCPSFAPLHTTPVGSSTDPGARLTNREARQLVCEIRTWARQFDAPDASALVGAMDDMERLLVRAWTEIDESLLRLKLADASKESGRASELRNEAVGYLSRWNDRRAPMQG